MCKKTAYDCKWKMLKFKFHFHEQNEPNVVIYREQDKCDFSNLELLFGYSAIAVIY